MERETADVEVVATGGGPPEVPLVGATAEAARAAGARPLVSLTHSRDTAGAVAVALVR